MLFSWVYHSFENYTYFIIPPLLQWVGPLKVSQKCALRKQFVICCFLGIVVFVWWRYYWCQLLIKWIPLKWIALALHYSRVHIAILWLNGTGVSWAEIAAGLIWFSGRFEFLSHDSIANRLLHWKQREILGKPKLPFHFTCVTDWQKPGFIAVTELCQAWKTKMDFILCHSW